MFLAALIGLRVVVHLKGGNYDNFYASQPRWLRLLMRDTLRSVTQIIVLRPTLRSMFDFDPSLSNKLRFVYNRLPYRISQPGRMKSVPSPSEPWRLLFLPNLMDSKGYLDLFDATRLLVREYHLNVRCHFWGLFFTEPTDVRVTSVKQAEKLFFDGIREFLLKQHVQYCDVVSGEREKEELNQSHFFVLPNQYDNEAQPVSIIEAMAHGNVVIATRYRSIPDLRDESCGTFVP